MKNTKDFLLEIAVEEMPAGYIRPALKELEQSFSKWLEASGIGRSSPVSFGTKNLLICYIKDLPVAQEASSKEIVGPPKSIAFDKDNNPTKQAIGFAKNQGVEVADLMVKNTPKGEYVVIQKKEQRRMTRELLQEKIPEIIKGMSFPKTMRWDDSGLKFARPVESVFALFGRENLNIRLGNVAQKKPRRVEPLQYLGRLKKKCMISWGERNKSIKSKILKAVKGISEKSIDEGLLEEVTFMVDSPEVFVGEFNKKFLDLPGDVLKASMAKHQRIFPVSKDNKLINKFIAVVDGKKRKNNRVRRNYENVLEAKLKDSLFFFDEDRKKPLSDNISQLKDLIFQRGLGNMFEKIQRLKQLCSFLCDMTGNGSLKKDTEAAAELSKTDLVTHMVGEFPSLQGIMGSVYAREQGASAPTASAIRLHYLPQGLNDELPETMEATILGISDRIDNVTGFLGIGMKVSGSYDPFGIRRNSQGLIQIVKNKNLKIDLVKLVDKAIELYGDKLKIEPRKLGPVVIDYIKERVDYLLGDIRPVELKDAVLSVGCRDIVDVFKRIKLFSSIKNETYFLEAAKVVERTSNILKGAKKEKIGDVEEGLFKEGLERSVWGAYLKSKNKIQDLIKKEKYDEATREYANAFYKVLHDFFEKVLVNAEDRSLRLNRLAMMKAINTLYTEHVADLAKLPQIVVK